MLCAEWQMKDISKCLAQAVSVQIRRGNEIKTEASSVIEVCNGRDNAKGLEFPQKLRQKEKFKSLKL